MGNIVRVVIDVKNNLHQLVSQTVGAIQEINFHNSVAKINFY